MADSQSKDMSFGDHLEDLTKTLKRVVIVLIGVFCVLFFFKSFLFDDIVLAPTQSDFYLYRWLGIDFDFDFINIEITAQFMVHMKVAFICAIILTFPYLVYEIWRFVAPALYEKEKRAIKKAFLFSGGLFYTGLAVGYSLVLPLMINFFSDYQVSEAIPNIFSLSSYISLFNSTVLIFGLVFQFPTIIAILSLLGILTRETMTKYRRHAICGILILAAIITPSGDPFSLIICSIPLYALYEFSILICKKKPVEDQD